MTLSRKIIVRKLTLQTTNKLFNLGFLTWNRFGLKVNNTRFLLQNIMKITVTNEKLHLGRPHLTNTLTYFKCQFYFKSWSHQKVQRSYN